MNELSSILRRTLLTKASKENPDYTIGRWRVYDLYFILENSIKGKHRCYEIAGYENEKILVVLLFNDRNEIYKTKYYFLKSGTDAELAGFLTRALLKRIEDKFQFVPGYSLKELEF